MRPYGRHAVVVLAATLVGLAVATWPPQAILITATALVAAYCASLLRVRLTRLRVSRPLAISTESIEGVPDDGFYRTSRYLVYGGLATSCLLYLRLGGVTVSDALFAGALTAAAVESVLVHDHRRVLPTGVWIGVLLFVAGGVVSTAVNSVDASASYAVIARVFYLVAAWFWTAAKAFRTGAQLWNALGLWVSSAALSGFWTLGQKYLDLPGAVDLGRFAGLADHVNDLGSLAACALVPALVLTWRDRRWAFATLGITVGLILSGSIGGGVAGLAALAFGLLAPGLTRPTLIALAVGAGLFILASPFIGSTAITRFSTSTTAGAQFNQDTFYIRLRTYRAAWERIKADPIIGTGLDVRSSSLLDVQTASLFQVHNLFLGRWFDSGILGLLGILTLQGALARAAWQQVKAGRDQLLALTLAAAFLAYLVTEMSEPSLYKRYSLVPALLIISLSYQGDDAREVRVTAPLAPSPEIAAVARLP